MTLEGYGVGGVRDGEHSAVKKNEEPERHGQQSICA
jgi:hypothetical protein